MICSRCHSEIPDDPQSPCPHCGVVKRSLILVATAKTDGIYRSVEEMPTALRERIAGSTGHLTCDTIVIANRAGEREIAKSAGPIPKAEPPAGFTLPPRVLQAIAMILAASVAVLTLWLFLRA